LSTRAISPEAQPVRNGGTSRRADGWKALLRDPLLLPGALAFAVFFGYAALDAGYAAAVWYPGAVFLLALTVLVLAFVRRPPASRATKVAIAALAAYTCWSFLSIAWADVKGDAWDGANRTLLYLVVFLLFALLPWRATTVAVLLGAYSLAIGVVGFAALASAARAPDPSSYFLVARLAEPAGYQNAECALLLGALWPALFLAAWRDVPVWVRAPMVANAGVLLQLALLTQTRASVVALPVTFAVFLVASPRRARTILFSALPAVAVAVAARPLLDVFPAVQHDEGARSAVASARDAVLLSAAALVLVGALAAWLDRRVSLGPRFARRGSIAVVGTFCAVSVVALAVAVRAVGNPVDRWDQFRRDERAASTTSYFSNGFGSNRYDIWRVALDEFRDAPLVGVGADNFAVGYLRERRSSEEPLYPHSLELRVLVQTGIVGAAVFAVFLGAALVRLRGLRSAPPWTGATAAAGAAIFAYWLVHGSVDWFWELPGLAAPAIASLALAGTIVRPEVEGETAAFGRPAAVAGVAVCAVAAVSLLLPWLAAEEVNQAAREWRRDPGAAFARLDKARALNPLADDPDLVAGAIASRLGDRARMRRAFLRAADRNPHNWYAWLELGIAEALDGRRQSALGYLAKAQVLDPGEDVIASVSDSVQAGRPISPIEIDRKLLRRVAVDQLGRQK